ncbi:MAG: DUF2975 domain-containing protein [Steroidobacteraceae bacterium]
MEPLRFAVLPLRVILVLAFAGATVLQTLSFPGGWAFWAQQHPELAWLRWPLTAFTAAEMLCVQVVLVSTWQLLTMVQKDRIFSPAAFRWVDAIIIAMGCAWVGLAAAWLVLVSGADDPGMPFLLLNLLLGGAALVLLVVVMRALLRQATALRSDMDAVI